MKKIRAELAIKVSHLARTSFDIRQGWQAIRNQGIMIKVKYFKNSETPCNFIR